jgi:NAD(P)-dependent dehydrogenase (short-subunit alcohol dehydrogenase family)
VSARRPSTEVRPLEGKVVAITGAARGIGLATARVLRSRGATVAVGDIDEVTATREAGRLGGGAAGYPVDVTDRGSFERFLSRAEDELGAVDVLINNAGIMAVGPVVEEPDEVARRTFDVNVHGVIVGTKLALERMVPRRSGHIVNLASLSGVAPVPHIATYCASKHAVVGFTEAVRREHRGDGIDVTLVMPSFVATELSSGTRGLRGLRMIQPGEVAMAIADAVARPRAEIKLPRFQGSLTTLGHLLPRRARDVLAGIVGFDAAASIADHEARRPYEERIASGDRVTEPR